MMRLKVVRQETECLKTGRHIRSCTGTSHVCYRCGFYMGPCDCAELGSLLDY
jgi:hypothetical protein